MDDLTYDVENGELKIGSFCFLISLFFSALDIFIFNWHITELIFSLLITWFLSSIFGLLFFVWHYTEADFYTMELGRPVADIYKPNLNKRVVFTSIASALTGSILIILMQFVWMFYFH